MRNTTVGHYCLTTRNGRNLRTAAVMLSLFVYMHLIACNERRNLSYASLQEAEKSGEVTRGWIPASLPRSAREIHLAYDPSSPRTWCSFTFSVGDSWNNNDRIQATDIVPPWAATVSGPTPAWWPDFLRGSINGIRLKESGFALYTLDEPGVGTKSERVLFIMNWKTGKGFFYRVPEE